LKKESGMSVSRKARPFRIERALVGEPAPNQPTPDGAIRSGEVAELKQLIESLRDDVRALSGETAAAVGGVDPDAFRQQIVEAERLKADLQELRDAIDRTKQEIASLRRADKDADKIATASEALRAVVGDTEGATDTIINAAESVEELSGRLCAQLTGDEAIGMVDEIGEHVTNIFEACNFQDITGQRITKVVNTMEFIDNRIARMMDIWGGHEAFAGVTVEEDETPPEGEVLHGPAMEGDASISQAEIDALFD
jgi:chemotaxis protein CheZ